MLRARSGGVSGAALSLKSPPAWRGLMGFCPIPKVRSSAKAGSDASCGSAAARLSLYLRELPGYPARLSPAADGGAWLAIFAPCNRLIELVLQETHYRTDMMAGVPREFWIAPALSSGRSFLEPLQCGGIRTMGVHKAWAPSRSYGLVVRLGPDHTPLTSMHSRADGHRHGTTCAIEVDGRLLVASKGGDAVLAPERTG